MKGGAGIPGRSLAWAALAVAARAGAAQSPAAEGPAEPVCLVPMLQNGDFGEALAEEVAGIPWWRARGALGGEVVGSGRERELYLRGERAGMEQFVPIYAPLADGIVLRGRVRGAGEMSLSGGPVVTHSFRTPLDASEDFEVVVRDVPQLAGKLRARLALALLGVSDVGEPLPSYWSRLELLVPLPCPSEAALQAEVLALFERFFAAVLAAALDDVGPAATPFRCFDFDAASGARLPGAPEGRAGDVAFHELLLDAWAAAPEARRGAWERELVRFVEAYQALCLNPATGLEQRYDPLRDVGLEHEPVQVHRGLAFLLDVASDGPEALRAGALAAAERMGRTILERGVLPDGEIAASYRPVDGEPFFDVPQLRRLDVPAQLARLAAATRDRELAQRALAAAEEAVATLAYDHYWPGDWANIDPGFDDNFGHYGARATTMWRSHPGNAAFRGLALSGFRRYAPLWRDALRYGGNVAADQVRCWEIVRSLADLEPATASDVAELLASAVHGHLQGEQLSGGVWIDTTVKSFRPAYLPVGDTGGVPQNLLYGLALAYGARDLGLASDEQRARFTAVLRQTVAEFGRAYGFVAERGAAPTAGGYAGSHRVALGLVEMLKGLAP